MSAVATDYKISFNLKGDSMVWIEQFINPEAIYEGDPKDVFQYKLSWSDYVANIWIEYYPTLATALARASVLAECVDFPDKCFVSDPEKFAQTAQKFLDKEVK